MYFVLSSECRGTYSGAENKEQNIYKKNCIYLNIQGDTKKEALAK